MQLSRYEKIKGAIAGATNRTTVAESSEEKLRARPAV